MNRTETAQLLTLIAETYNQKFELSESKVEAWHSLLQDLDWPLAQAAVKRHILTSKWPPTVAEIREASVEMSQPPRLTALEAWGRVLDAIRVYGWPREAEALEAMGPEVAAVVRRFGWMELCMAEKADVIRGQFTRLWEQQAGREQTTAQLPAAMQRQVAALAEWMALSTREEDIANG